MVCLLVELFDLFLIDADSESMTLNGKECALCESQADTACIANVTDCGLLDGAEDLCHLPTVFLAVNMTFTIMLYVHMFVYHTEFTRFYSQIHESQFTAEVCDNLFQRVLKARGSASDEGGVPDDEITCEEFVVLYLDLRRAAAIDLEGTLLALGDRGANDFGRVRTLRHRVHSDP